MHYPAKFEAAPEGGFVVTFRDIPEAVTQGDTEADALAMAVDALECALEFYIEDKRSVPKPSRAQEGETFVNVSPKIAAGLSAIDRGGNDCSKEDSGA